MGKIRETWNRLNRRLSGHYRKSLVTLLLLSSLPGIIIGFVIFLAVRSQIENELQHIHQNQLYQTAEMIDGEFSNVELFLAHWAFDANFNENLDNLDFAYRYKEIHDIYRTLLVMEGSNPLFERVELYVSKPMPVVFTKEGYIRLHDPSHIGAYEQLLEQGKTLYWSDSFAGLNRFGSAQPSTLSLIHQIPGLPRGDEQAYGALIIYLDRSSVLSQVETLTPYNQGTTFLFEAGRFGNSRDFLLTTAPDNRPTELDVAIYEEMEHHRDRAGTFLFYWNRQTYSVTYGQFSRLGSTWYYVSSAPLTSITAPVIFISKLIIAVNLLILLLAGVLSWLASRKLYSPIDKLVRKINPRNAPADRIQNEFELIESRWNDLSRESQVLQRRLDEHLPHLREGFLMQLLQGYLYSFTKKELEERMMHFGWEVRHRRFRVILVQLLGFSRLEGRFSEGDEGLVTFAAANMVEEVIGNAGMEADVINFHDLSVGVLVNFPDVSGRENHDRELARICKEMIDCIDDILHMQATICLSRITDSVKLVPVMFEETRLALGLREIQDSSQIIDLEKTDVEDRARDFNYPFDLEKEITYAVRLGNESEAVRYIRRFVNRLKAENANEAVLKQGVLQLLGSILHVVLQSGLSTHQLYEGANLYEQLNQIREPEEITEWFERKVVRPFMQEWSQKKDRQMRQLVEKTVILLNEQYRNDISLEYCADELKISPYVLSKAFKKITGLNFIDYLTHIRLERAKRLLQETDLKISEVAEQVGYQHSYFNRLFKKNEGLTPGQYRQQNRPSSKQAE